MTMTSATAVRGPGSPRLPPFIETITEVEHYTRSACSASAPRAPASLRFRLRRIRHDRPARRRAAGVPGLLDSRAPNWDEGARVLLDHNGARRPAHRAALQKGPARRQALGQEEAHGHAGARRARSRQAPVDALDGHRRRALREPPARPRRPTRSSTRSCSPRPAARAAELRYAEENRSLRSPKDSASSPSSRRGACGSTPPLTREEHPRRMRITTAIESGKLFEDLGVAPFSARHRPG